MAITMEKSLFIFLFIAITSIASTQAGNFNITNKCNYTVWAAAVPGGGVKLNTGESWNMNIANGTNNARIWGRTNCTFDNSGVGKCQTGDCNNTLECKTFGTPPNTILEFALNMYNNLDFYDVSLVQGFNIPIKLTPSSSSCGMVNCTRNITDESKFKNDHDPSKRLELSERIRQKYADRIPVIVERGKNDVPDITKHKFLVPKDLQIGKFIHEIRKHMKAEPGAKIRSDTAVFLFVKNGTLMRTCEPISAVYDRYKDNDGFLYITYYGESTYGC